MCTTVLTVKNVGSLGVSYILKSAFCISMYEVLSRCRPDSGGWEEVILRDGICGAQDLVYFPLWIPVLPAGFSQVLASISLGSCEERGAGVRGLVRGWRRLGEGGGGAGGRERATALESVTHNSAQLGRRKQRQRTRRDRG